MYRHGRRCSPSSGSPRQGNVGSDSSPLILRRSCLCCFPPTAASRLAGGVPLAWLAHRDGSPSWPWHSPSRPDPRRPAGGEPAGSALGDLVRQSVHRLGLVRRRCHLCSVCLSLFFFGPRRADRVVAAGQVAAWRRRLHAGVRGWVGRVRPSGAWVARRMYSGHPASWASGRRRGSPSCRFRFGHRCRRSPRRSCTDPGRLLAVVSCGVVAGVGQLAGSSARR